MSDTTEKRKANYLQKCSAKQMQNGSFKRVRISINKDEIAKLADEKGYVALNIFERREPDTQYGNTHNITVQERNVKASDDDNEAPTTAE